MDQQGFDPVNKTLSEVAQFMERIEQAEDFDPSPDSKPEASSNKKSKTGLGKSKHCLIHGQGGHSSDECKTPQALVKDSKSNASGGKKKFGNKTWKKKPDESTDKNKKDFLAFVKKSIKEGVEKELNSTNKKHKVSCDLNAFDKDLKDFNCEDMENPSLEYKESSLEV